MEFWHLQELSEWNDTKSWDSASKIQVQCTRNNDNLRYTIVLLTSAFFWYEHHDFTPASLKSWPFGFVQLWLSHRLKVWDWWSAVQQRCPWPPGVQIFWRRARKAKSKNRKHYFCKRWCEEWWCSVQVFLKWSQSLCLLKDQRHQDESWLIPKVVYVLPHTAASPTASDETNPLILELVPYRNPWPSQPIQASPCHENYKPALPASMESRS